MKKALLFLIFIIVLSSFVIAAPPFISGDFVGGMTIETTAYEFVKQNQMFKAHFHVFNASGHPVFNDTTSCALHLYNHSGSHIYENENLEFDSNGQEWKADIAAGNFSDTGAYHYIAWCNDSSTGGFLASEYTVTKDGLDNTPNINSGLPMLFFMIFFIIGLFLLGFLVDFHKMEIVNLVIKRGCFLTAIMLMMYTSSLLFSLMDYSNLYILSKEMAFLMEWIGWAGYITAFYITIQALFDILSLNKKKKEKDVYEVSD